MLIVRFQKDPLISELYNSNPGSIESGDLETCYVEFGLHFLCVCLKEVILNSTTFLRDLLLDPLLEPPFADPPSLPIPLENCMQMRMWHTNTHTQRHKQVAATKRGRRQGSRSSRGNRSRRPRDSSKHWRSLAITFVCHFGVSLWIPLSLVLCLSVSFFAIAAAEAAPKAETPTAAVTATAAALNRSTVSRVSERAPFRPRFSALFYTCSVCACTSACLACACVLCILVSGARARFCVCRQAAKPASLQAPASASTFVVCA